MKSLVEAMNPGQNVISIQPKLDTTTDETTIFATCTAHDMLGTHSNVRMIISQHDTASHRPRIGVCTGMYRYARWWVAAASEVTNEVLHIL